MTARVRLPRRSDLYPLILVLELVIVWVEFEPRWRAGQVSKGTYDLEANLALLRFYQYNPATAKIPIVCKVSCEVRCHSGLIL